MGLSAMKGCSSSRQTVYRPMHRLADGIYFFDLQVLSAEIRAANRTVAAETSPKILGNSRGVGRRALPGIVVSLRHGRFDTRSLLRRPQPGPGRSAHPSP